MKGYSNVTYLGGPHDGDTDELPAHILKDTVRVMSEYYYVTPENGEGMEIRRFTGRLHKNWHCYLVSVYQKRPKKKNSAGTVYEFIEEVEVERCYQRTKEGRQCRREAERNTLYCKQHAK